MCYLPFQFRDYSVIGFMLHSTSEVHPDCSKIPTPLYVIISENKAVAVFCRLLFFCVI